MELRKPRTIITGIIITGITALVAPTGTIIALAGRGEVSAKNRSAELDETSLRPGAVSSAVFCDIRRDPQRLVFAEQLGC